MDETFFPTCGVRRRDPTRYTKNPARVLYLSQGGKRLALVKGVEGAKVAVSRNKDLSPIIPAVKRV